MVQIRVVGYVTRRQGRELLVFDHRDAPEAGTQVPAGRVRRGESLEHAAVREVVEECGLEARVVRRLGVEHWRNPETGIDNENHFFHLEVLSEAPDGWEHTVGGVGEDQGFVFLCRWVSLGVDLPLASGQHRFLPAIVGMVGEQTNPGAKVQLWP